MLNNKEFKQIIAALRGMQVNIAGSQYVSYIDLVSFLETFKGEDAPENKNNDEETPHRKVTF